MTAIFIISVVALGAYILSKDVENKLKKLNIMKQLLITITIILCISLSGCHNKKSTNENKITPEKLEQLQTELKASIIEVDIAQIKKDSLKLK